MLGDYDRGKLLDLEVEKQLDGLITEEKMESNMDKIGLLSNRQCIEKWNRILRKGSQVDKRRRLAKWKS